MEGAGESTLNLLVAGRVAHRNGGFVLLSRAALRFSELLGTP